MYLRVLEIYLKIYELDPAKFLSAPGLAWQAALKDWSKIRSFNWYWYVINGRKQILEEEYVTLFIDMQKLIRNTWKIMIKIGDCHIFNVGM